ncbi:helix-turn-helix transcriptional regulator [Paenibacillus sp. TRM 82003]|uniref:winged helix-turn-helix transcriptional regulator n=1 Tax=Kineococcus sp. TRM81007 TaxID=2925831 RepID=UPI001F589622|nr:helix-turn-helix domain-containing protein [Kineococcus sp. TRM81007]MCI2237237.1 helix-turn-helix transcriptional regulator [Kineococcus sp. TRM81007]MCI3919419.1 helix-turn-helix transcriptional regulator [Paenibacillus sp. TRM 82003]
MHCSLAQSLQVVGDWWSPLILRDLHLGVDRFEDLVRDLGISRNLLTTRLQTLIAGGVVQRERYQEHPPRDRYVLTAAGRELVPVLMVLTAWGDRWATPPEGPPIAFEHRDCAHPFTPQVHCSHCGQQVHADDVVAVPGPGGRAGPGTMLIGRYLPTAGTTRTGPPPTAVDSTTDSAVDNATGDG